MYNERITVYLTANVLLSLCRYYYQLHSRAAQGNISRVKATNDAAQP